MTRLLKILGWVAAAIVLLVVTVVVAVNLVPGAQYKSLVASLVKSTTGRELVIGGDIDVRLGSSFRVAASDIRFSNPDWASRPEMFTGRYAEAEVMLTPLLNGVLDVRFVLESPDLLLETNADGRSNWQMGGATAAEQTEETVSAREGGGFPLRPFIREVRLEQVKVAFSDAAAGRTHNADLQTILLRSMEDDLVVELKGRIDDRALSLEGGLGSAAPAGGETPAGFHLAGTLGEIGVNASGTLGAISAVTDVDLVVEAKVPTLTALSPFVGRDLPDQGPLTATLRISGADGQYSVTDIKANLDAEVLKAAITGDIADLSALSGIDLSVSADTSQLPELVALVGVEVPVKLPPVFRTEASISGSMEVLSVADFRADFEDGGMKAVATGQVGNVIALNGVNADVTVESASLAAFSPYAKTELPDLGPLKASATVASSGETFSVNNIKAELAATDIQATLQGSVADVIGIKGLDAKLQASLSSLATLNELTGQELPDSGPLSLSGKLTSEAGLDAPSKISGSLTGDGVKASFRGDIGDLLAAKGISLVLNVEGDSVTQVARLAGQDLQHDEPVKLEGNVTLGPPTYKADSLKLQLGESRLTGEVAFTPPQTDGAKSSLTGRLHLDRFDLEPYVVFIDVEPTPPEEQAAANTGAGTAPDATLAMPPSGTEGAPAGQVAEAATAAPPAKEESKKVFPDDPLPFEMLQQLDADIEITADEFATRQVMYYDMTAKVVSNNGVLKLDPFRATVGQGTFLATARLDASRSPADLSVDVNMNDGTTRDFGGRYNLTVDVDGTGDSVAQIMAGLDGQIIVDVRDLELKKSALTQFGRGLLDSLNPFDKEEEKSELTCAIVRLDIQDGIANADDRIVAQMTRVTWFGGGKINLKNEKIDIGVQSKPRKGLGISVGGLASLVHVGGTLANPKIQLDPKEVAKKYGQNALTVATGGLFLLAKGLWDKSKANSDVCYEILTLEEKKDRKKEGAAGPGEADDDQPALLDHDI